VTKASFEGGARTGHLRKYSEMYPTRPAAVGDALREMKVAK
jgi:hypothetical protein